MSMLSPWCRAVSMLTMFLSLTASSPMFKQLRMGLVLTLLMTKDAENKEGLIPDSISSARLIYSRSGVPRSHWSEEIATISLYPVIIVGSPGWNCSL